MIQESAIVSVTSSCTVVELFYDENVMSLKSGLEVTEGL